MAMFTSFVNIYLLFMVFIKFGYFVTLTVSTTTRKIDDAMCEPNPIHLTISDDLPKGDNSTKIRFFCNNWENINLTVILETDSDEHRYFSLHHFYVRNVSYLGLEIKSVLKIHHWNTFIRVQERSRNITLNRIQFQISTKEVNDPPTIQHFDESLYISKNTPVGTTIASLLVFDPDYGSLGQLSINKTKEYCKFQTTTDTTEVYTSVWSTRSLETKELCNKILDYKYTQGPNEKYPYCWDCWCCKLYVRQVYTCYSWTKVDIAVMGSPHSVETERKYCAGLGYNFTQGHNENFPGCKDCWCCKPIKKEDILCHILTTEENEVTGPTRSIQTDKQHCELDTDIPEEFKLVQVSNNLIEIRTRTALDADKYWNNSSTFEDKPGHTFIIRVQVIDGGGLIANSTVNVTVTDIAENNPVCRNDTSRIETTSLNKDDKIVRLHSFCEGQNYVSKNVTYHLTSDNCTVFNVSTDGEVMLHKEVDKDMQSCNLTVKAADTVFPSLTTSVSVIIRFSVGTCPNDTDCMNLPWKTGRTGKFSFKKCPVGYSGKVLRYCNESGYYQDPVYNCTKYTIETLHRKLTDNKNNVSLDSADIIDELDTLSNATSGTDRDGTLFFGEINKTLDILSIITNGIKGNTTHLENITDSFIAVVNNLLDSRASKSWIVNMNQTGTGADIVLKTIDNFLEKISATAKNVTAELSKSNLYLKMGSVQSCKEPLTFPKRERAGVSEWLRTRMDELVIECDSFVQSYSGILYRNLSKIIPVKDNSTKSMNLQLNAPVISFAFYRNYQGKLVPPVEINFQLYNNTWDNAKCSFWAESHGNSSPGHWSDEGCRQKGDDKNKDFVVCVCDHLTNFAVLMSPSTDPIGVNHVKALSTISKIGCIISMVCLVLTIATYAYFWRFIKSVRLVIHLNLSCLLIIAYILFLAGINRTENKDVCTALAVLLHLVFLAVVFGMLTEGCYLSYTLLQPLSTRKPGIPLLIASYVLAITIVIVSMAASQLEGYGTKKLCWLSTDSGMIWAFLVPVLVVVLVNAVIIVLVVRIMCNTKAISSKSKKERARATLRCILILMPVMGLTWVFGGLSVNEDTVAFQYIFAILNSLQGMLIFIFHCLMDNKIKDAFLKQRSKLFMSQSYTVSDGKRLKTQITSDL